MSGVINSLCDEKVEQKGETMKYLRKWLRVHAWRSAFADIPALLSYVWLVFGT
jgi:hypothetical protein